MDCWPKGKSKAMGWRWNVGNRGKQFENYNFENNIQVDPFEQRTACKANLLIAQGNTLGGHGV